MPDVVSVPEAAGREALARLLGYGQPAVAPGPVALSAGGRVLFYVADGGAEDLPELLEWLDWGGVRLDLTAVAARDLTDPPVRWLHPATVRLQGPGHPWEAAVRAEDGAGRGLADGGELSGLSDFGGFSGSGHVSDAGAARDARDADDARDTDTDTDAGAGADADADDDTERAARRDVYPITGLPEPPELIALLATIAAACHRLAVAAAR